MFRHRSLRAFSSPSNERESVQTLKKKPPFYGGFASFRGGNVLFAIRFQTPMIPRISTLQKECLFKGFRRQLRRQAR